MTKLAVVYSNGGDTKESVVAKRRRSDLITASFHYLIKTAPNEDDADEPIVAPFSVPEFQRIVARISDPAPLDETDEQVILRIKQSLDMPFGPCEEVDPGLYFGSFDGAYYGQRYRNNVLGDITADSLNLRQFFYLVTLLRDGRILIGVTYHGQFGDYDGVRRCFTHLLSGNYQIASRTIKSLAAEIGDGEPIELKLTYRRAGDRAERRPIFGQSGVLAIRSTDAPESFRDQVSYISNRMAGDQQTRKRELAQIVREGQIIELDEDEIIGCSALIKDDGRYRTIYFLGDNNFSTKFPLRVGLDHEGMANRIEVRDEMVRILRDSVIPLLRT